MPDRLYPNTAIGAGQSLSSTNGVFMLAMQGDGNLVVYDQNPAPTRPIWASNTAGNPGAWASMQADGNLVVYDGSNKPLWASNTAGKPGAWVVMQDDGNLVIYSASGPPIWASNTTRVARIVGFTAKQHGFRFPNDFANTIVKMPNTFNDIETMGRCGGMAFAALDYYVTGAHVPTYRTSMFAPETYPSDDHWLADYIYDRLVNSLATPSAPKNLDWSLRSDHDTVLNGWGVKRLTRETEFPRLRAEIDSGRPAVLALIGATSVNPSELGSRNHQVVAYGYAHYPGTGAITIWVYDNNTPEVEVTLTSTPSTPHWTASNGGVYWKKDPWRGFFVQEYTSAHPPIYTRIPPAVTEAVRYGAIIKLGHIWTGYTLHSHPLVYGHPGTSGQQQVTAFAGSDDNDLWRVKGPHGQPENYKANLPVEHGDIIRLEHVLTKRNLHSHPGHPSPVTGQQEVTCFGSQGIGDSNDNWLVEVDQVGTWKADKRVRLIHINTTHSLHSHHGKSHPSWTAGQQEVTAFQGRDANDWWWLLERR